ncbi:MAG: RHS repeat-associated core domain-containing protein [Phycisphaerales bacterium]|nr:RHS repeat-associated core domain-containing protein [Phycisphaerales bacterium]
MNCDGDVTFADTNIFVAKIGCPNITDCNVPCTWTHGDINGDGVLSWDDIDPYIAQFGTAGRKFEWDAENRLIRVGPLHATPAAGDVKVEYAYDYLGRRIERRKYTWQTANPPASWTLAESTRYVWSDWLLLMELDGLQGNAVLRKYTWGLDLSGLNGAGASGGAGILPAGLTGAGGIGGLLAVYDTNGTTTGQNPEADDMAYAYLYNANGDVGQVVDPNAASAAASLVARYEYDPYGGVIFESGSYAASNAWRFSTKQFDPVTGLGCWGYRWYSPRLGRWVSRDPIEEEGGACLYGYVANGPFGLTDGVGLMARPNGFDPEYPVSRVVFEPYGTCGDCRQLCRIAQKESREQSAGVVYGVNHCENGTPCWCVCASHFAPVARNDGNAAMVAAGIIAMCVERHEIRQSSAVCCKGNQYVPWAGETNPECAADIASLDCLGALTHRCDGLFGRKARCLCRKALRTYAEGWIQCEPEGGGVCPHADQSNCRTKKEQLLTSIGARQKADQCLRVLRHGESPADKDWLPGYP